MQEFSIANNRNFPHSTIHDINRWVRNFVSQIKDGDNPASLILAKTLLGSDSIFHGGVSTNFLGSPLTL